MSSPIPQRSLGGDASHVKVGAIGHGLMMLTWTPNPAPDEEAFASMKAAADAGATFWNSAQFYGQPEDPMANLKLLNRFFDKYPDYAEKIVLSVKGGMDVEKGAHGGPSSSVENLRADLKRITEALGDKKKVDIYECARVDPSRTIEETIQNMVTLKNEGWFKYIGVSEISADALRRANAVHPIAAVEIEVSIWAMEDETYAVVKACDELGIALIAYSPLGRGFLTGKFKKPEDIPEGDMRRHFPKFQGENFKVNLKLVHAVDDIAKKKGVPPSQLALAWILKLSPHAIPIPGSSSTERALENIGGANVTLTDDEFAEINNLLKQFESVGDRYGGPVQAMNWGTGKQ